MKQGFVLGKFMPVHNGHLALINFALDHCDELIVLLCHHEAEPIAAAVRKKWLEELLKGDDRIHVHEFHYDPQLLSDSSDSSVSIAAHWAEAVHRIFPSLGIIFSSERYGQYMAQHLGIEYRCFDEQRNLFPVSASAIRNDPFFYWEHIPPAVRPFFVKTVCLSGTESTGKSTMAEDLAKHFNTEYVPEMARDIMEHTNECTYDHLLQIAELQAKTILQKKQTANKVLFCDTDLNITRSYSRFLFNRELPVDPWIEKANHFDLYLFLENDCPYVQDGTRLSFEERDRLNVSHKKQLYDAGINYIAVTGNWSERFKLAIAAVEKLYSRS